jgi:hypothetical protein
LLEHAFRNGIGSVNYEEALWRAEFCQQERERASKERLEFDGCVWEMPEVDAHRLRCIWLGGCRGQYKCALADTGLAVYDHRLAGASSRNRRPRDVATIETYTSGAVD